MAPVVEIIAHRGFSERAPENTVAALEAALAAGADAVEFDVHTAACGTPVLFHDAMLSRTTNGVGPLRRRTVQQLKALDAGSWFSADFAGERIPTLEEAFEVLKGRVPRVYVEVKGFRELEDLDRMVRLARQGGVFETVTFIAMNWTLLDRMRSQAPDLSIGYIVDEVEKADDAIRRCAGDARALVDFNVDFVLADPALVDRCRAQQTDVAVWTVDDPDVAARLLGLGVGRITTNRVSDLLTWKSALP